MSFGGGLEVDLQRLRGIFSETATCHGAGLRVGCGRWALRKGEMQQLHDLPDSVED